MKHEFEALAIRNGETISHSLYENTIKRYYMSDNHYHEAHGGANESKQEYVKRVFGGKVNTAKTVALKAIAEACKENRWCLRGNSTATKAELDRMDRQIADHIAWKATGERHGSAEHRALLKAWERSKDAAALRGKNEGR